MIIIYTDGSCSRNPGPGGFGVVITDNNNIIAQYQERTDSTTNNREEMKAIIWALENYGRGLNYPPIVYSDSMYCVNTFNTWMKSWKANGWKRAKGKQVENLDLVKKYDKLIEEGYQIDLRYIKGHAGHEFNELADKLATGTIIL